MALHPFFHPIEVRYGDLDPQGHVNNANFLTFLEQARVHYLIHLGLFDPAQSFMEVGIILADAHVIFKSPIYFSTHVIVEARVTRLGNKSIHMAYRILDGSTGAELAAATTVQVTYDYRSNQTISVPPDWREKIRAFENLSD